jgi:hypothetical protein
VIAPRCLGCGGPVLELRGQHAHLDAVLVADGEPPPSSAGAWHATCLAASGFGPRWRAALERHLVRERRYARLGEADGWAVLRDPRGVRVALPPTGGALELAFAGAGRPVPGGVAFPIYEAEYNLHLADPAAIAALQAALRADGAYSVLALASRLGIAERIHRPDVLEAAAFRLDDPEGVAEWGADFTVAAVSYDAVVPEAIARYVEPPLAS